MKTIWSHVCLNKKQILCLCIFVMLSAIAQMLLPSLLAEMINRGVADTNVSQIWIYGMVMAGVASVSYTHLMLLQGYISMIIVLLNMRKDYSQVHVESWKLPI